MKTYYLTTAIDYVNSLPHLGTAYEKIAADVIARYKRLRGYEVFLQMGTDEHSLNVERQAAEQGKAPKLYCDEMVVRFEAIWKKLDIEYDRFIRTTDEDHIRTVQDLFDIMRRKGDIITGTYSGWYCVSCEAFLKEGELMDGCCPTHKRPAEWLTEENYFFKLSHYAEKLLKHIENNPGFIEPKSRRNEILSLIRSGLEDISVSRSSVSWGIPLSFDKGHVVYVWFDALINYVTGAGYWRDKDRFSRVWPADIHVIGKDITRFHCVIWPAMLMSAGLPLPKKVFGHGFVHISGEKMSKTRGTMVNPLDVVEEFSSGALRYFLMREIAFDRDGDFSWEKMTERYNADLANNLGNLVSRTLTMVGKYCGNAVPEVESRELLPAAREILSSAPAVAREYCEAMDRLRFDEALKTVWRLILDCNKLIEDTAPWNLYKEGRITEIEQILYVLLESIALTAVFISPVMPAVSRKIRELLSLDSAVMSLEGQELTSMLKPGTHLHKPEPLFPRKN